MKQLKDILVTSARRFYTEKYSDKAATLAFTSLLTIVPMLTIAIYLLTIFPFFNDLYNWTKHYVFENFIPQSGAVIEQYLDHFSQQASHMPTTSILFLLLSVLMLFNLIKSIINNIWGSPKYKSNWHSSAHFFVIATMPILMSVGTYVSYQLFESYWFSSTVKFLGLKLALTLLLPILITTFCFSFIYIVVPSCRVKTIDGVIGGFIAAILFETAKSVFAFYIRIFPSYELIYGTLAAVPIFLVWLYISWSIVVFGAIISNTCAVFRKESS